MIGRPRTLNAENVIYVHEGQDLVVSWQVLAYPPPNATCYLAHLNGTDEDITTDVEIDDASSVLHKLTLAPLEGQSGNYSCRLENGVGSSVVQFQVAAESDQGRHT